MPDHPVVLHGLHTFAVWGNRLAFERAGITRDTPAPAGGEIKKDAPGNPTGILVNNAQALLTKAVPPPTSDQLGERVIKALDALIAHGYTSVHEAGADDCAAGDARDTRSARPAEAAGLRDARGARHRARRRVAHARADVRRRPVRRRPQRQGVLRRRDGIARRVLPRAVQRSTGSHRRRRRRVRLRSRSAGGDDEGGIPDRRSTRSAIAPIAKRSTSSRR